MKKLKNILKTSLVAAFVATISVSCGDQQTTDDTGTSDAITETSESTQNLSKPRPAPIGDTAETGEQADQFGDLPANVDTAARQQAEMDKQKKKQENPVQRPQ